MVKSNIVIVGGGGVGTGVARTLSGKLDHSRYDLILVSLSDQHIHIPATLRMSVDSPDVEKLTDSAVAPFDNLFVNGNGTVKIGKVIGIQKNSTDKGGIVELDSGETLPFAYLVVATGSKWEGPIAYLGTEYEEKSKMQEYLSTWRKRFDKAQDIVIVGAGSVGLELAGELRDVHQSKAITIVHSGVLPLNDTYPDKFRNKVLKAFKARNVDFIFGDRIDELPDEVMGSIRTRNGKQLRADLVVPTRGGQPNTAFLKSLSSEVLNDFGRVRTRPTLQLYDFPDIFAAGDIIDFQEQKSLAKAPGHVAVVAANIMSLINGQEPAKEYKGTFEVLFLTNGKGGGVGYIGALCGILPYFGDWVISNVKSKGLFVNMARKELGLPPA